MRRLAVTLVAAAVLLVPAAPASAACPSGQSVTFAGLLGADGAFVGRLVKRSGDRLTYRVDTRVKGDLGRRVRVTAGGACTPRARKGRRIGLLLDRRGGRWHSASRALAPGALLKAAQIGP
jgi:hypothetical protein